MCGLTKSVHVLNEFLSFNKPNFWATRGVMNAQLHWAPLLMQVVDTNECADYLPPLPQTTEQSITSECNGPMQKPL
jgi:hypothetical protein